MQQVFQRFYTKYQIEPYSNDLGLLKQIATAFSHLPYENVTKILKQARNSGSESCLRRTGEVLEDHLRWNTGGTCFSLCNALLEVLVQNGFDAFVAMGDMHYGQNIHCAVIVRFPQQSYLLDPGYLLYQPIALPAEGTEISVRTPMNKVLLQSEGSQIYSLHTEEAGQKKWRYRLRAYPVERSEFEKHWIGSFSLNSMETILLSRIVNQSRIYFRKDRLEKVSSLSREKTIVQPGEATLLSSVFGVPADMIEMARAALNGRK